MPVVRNYIYNGDFTINLLNLPRQRNIFDAIDLCPQVDGVVEKDYESFILPVYTNA